MLFNTKGTSRSYLAVGGEEGASGGASWDTEEVAGEASSLGALLSRGGSCQGHWNAGVTAEHSGCAAAAPVVDGLVILRTLAAPYGSSGAQSAAVASAAPAKGKRKKDS